MKTYCNKRFENTRLIYKNGLETATQAEKNDLQKEDLGNIVDKNAKGVEDLHFVGPEAQETANIKGGKASYENNLGHEVTAEQVGGGIRKTTTKSEIADIKANAEAAKKEIKEKTEAQKNAKEEITQAKEEAEAQKDPLEAEKEAKLEKMQAEYNTENEAIQKEGEKNKKETAGELSEILGG